MAASFLASFLFFLLTGGYVLYGGLGFAQDPGVKVLVSLALLFNAIFYHYVAAYTEMDVGVREKLKDASPFEWIVRVLNQCILLSLWFWLEQGWTLFGIFLILLYLSYLLWDRLTWDYFDDHKVFIVDLIGLFVSVAYFFAGYVVLGEVKIDPRWDKTFYFFFGILSVAYLALPVIGVIRLRFRIFHGENWRHPGLH